MNFGHRDMVRVLVMGLAICVTMLACSQSPTDDTKPVVTVYASPT